MIKKILIVDDSSVARKILRSCLLKDQGYDFYEAGDGQGGLEKFKEIQPDVTFMDLTMPVMDGYEALEKIIQFDKNALIVVVTADVQLKSIKKVMDLGAFMVLNKPLNKEDLQDVLLKAQETLHKAG
ncbi:MAG: response regulator [Nitrospinota bacterium]